MKSLLSYIIPMQVLPSTIHDISRQKQYSWTMPLEEIIIHSPRKNLSILSLEKKIEVTSPLRTPTQNESFSSM